MLTDGLVDWVTITIVVVVVVADWAAWKWEYITRKNLLSPHSAGKLTSLTFPTQYCNQWKAEHGLGMPYFTFSPSLLPSPSLSLPFSLLLSHFPLRCNRPSQCRQGGCISSTSDGGRPWEAGGGREQGRGESHPQIKERRKSRSGRSGKLLAHVIVMAT